MSKIETILRKRWPTVTFDHSRPRTRATVTFGKRHTRTSIVRDIQIIRNRIERRIGYIPIDFYAYTEDDKTITTWWTEPKTRSR